MVLCLEAFVLWVSVSVFRTGRTQQQLERNMETHTYTHTPYPPKKSTHKTNSARRVLLCSDRARQGLEGVLRREPVPWDGPLQLQAEFGEGMRVRPEEGGEGRGCMCCCGLWCIEVSRRVHGETETKGFRVTLTHKHVHPTTNPTHPPSSRHVRAAAPGSGASPPKTAGPRRGCTRPARPGSH